MYFFQEESSVMLFMMTKNFNIIEFPVHTDGRGSLVPVEFSTLPFVPQRIYYLFDSKETRGAHAHLIEEEIFVCIKGKCRALIDPDGTGKQEIWLDNPQKAIYCGVNCWHEFDSFSDDAVLLAISSTQYLPGTQNYVAEYKMFREMDV